MKTLYLFLKKQLNYKIINIYFNEINIVIIFKKYALI